MHTSQRWYYADAEQTFGPIDSREIGELISQGVISQDTWVTPEHTENWNRASASAFADYFAVSRNGNGAVSEDLSATNANLTSSIHEVGEDYQREGISVSNSGDGNRVHRIFLALAGWQCVSRPWFFMPGLVLGFMILGGVFWARLHRQVGASHRGRISEVSTTPPEGTPSAAETDSISNAASLPTGVVVKGLHIGMDGEEATKAIIAQGEGKITVAPTTYRNVAGYDILFPLPGQRVGTRHGQIWIDRNSHQVTTFFFDGHLSDYLFNTADLTAKEFAQKFIDSYHIPTIKPTEFSHLQGWVYDSPEGWTLHIMIDKTVDVSLTPDRKFD